MPQEESLDGLADRARSGDRGAEDRFFSELRVRFMAVAKRRVRAEELEDVVQEALRVVLLRYASRPPISGVLPWSFVVLRNVIGNAYQRRRRLEMTRPLEESLPLAIAVTAGTAGADPLEVLDRSETLLVLERALETLAHRYPRCALLFRALLRSLDEGGGTHEISTRALALVRQELPDMNPENFYVALHRCRARLREQFRAAGARDVE